MQYLQSVSLRKVVLSSDQATRQLESTIRLQIYYFAYSTRQTERTIHGSVESECGLVGPSGL